MRTLGPEELRDLDRAVRLEWLHADGRGGWASSTVLGLNARREHGLLVVQSGPPVGRVNLLARVDERLEFADGTTIELATSRYAGAVHPRGLDFAESFTLDPLPALAFATPRGRLLKTVARLHDTDAVVVQYEWEGSEPAALAVRPLLAYRSVSSLQHERDDLDPQAIALADTVACGPFEGWPSLTLRLAGAQWLGEAWWYRRFEYSLDRERGLDHHEDLWSPGEFRVGLRPGRVVALVAAAGALPGAEPLALLQHEKRRQRALSAGSGGLEALLLRAADTFLVRRGAHGHAVIASYPRGRAAEELRPTWEIDGGRDAAIALPGLCLATGRAVEARRVLHELAARLRDGLVPCRFSARAGTDGPDGGEPETGFTLNDESVDTSLWFVLAVQRLREAEPLAERDRRLESAVDQVIDAYLAGTRHGIGVRADGLVEAGGPGLALTWMDARVDGSPVTPRHGCPIEVQALWFNALLAGAEAARGRGDERRAAALGQVAARCRESVQRVFWCARRGYLADVVAADGALDFGLRPNQLLAIGLPHGLLPRERALSVLAAVEAALLTPRGLRTLAPDEPGYRGRCEGDPEQRARSCHQGTVWPWLVGVWAEARLRLLGEAGKRGVHEWLAAFAGHGEEAGLGQVGESFDGDPPHAPRGALAHAPSVGELLRTLRRVGRAPRPDGGRPSR